MDNGMELRVKDYCAFCPDFDKLLKGQSLDEVRAIDPNGGTK